MASFKDLIAKIEHAPLSPGQKRLVMIVLVALLLILVVWYAVANEEKPKRRAMNPVASTVLTDVDTRAVGIDSIRSDLRTLTQSFNEYKSKNTAETGTDKKVVSQAEFDALKRDLEMVKKRAKDENDKPQKSDTTSPVPTDQNKGKGPHDVAAAERELSSRSMRPEDVYRRNDFESTGDLNVVQTSSAETNMSKDSDPPKIRTIEEVEPKTVAVKEEESDILYLPATTMLTGTLITGMDAPTSKQARTDPFPALVRIQKEAILPNNFRADVRDCGMIVGGYGDLSSERAYLRGETISCVRNDGGVIEVSIDAYASGEDGKAGVRGNVVSKQKEYITRAMMAAFIQGASQLFSVQSIPTIRISRGDSDKDDSAAFQQAFNPNAVQGAAVSGVGSALNRISEYYMDMAENLFPVIEIDAGRQIDFIIKKGASLKIKNIPKASNL